MEPYNLILYFFYSILLTSGAAQGSLQNRRHGGAEHEMRGGAAFRPTKLFVFGDSYADTGNVRKSLANSWREPYGITFPGKPAGRFSDGRVLTDYFAKSLGLKTPIAYRWKKVGGSRLRNGVNFAYGGSGVFDTDTSLSPNMTAQIDSLEKLIKDSIYTKWDLKSSVVLVSVAGNDYGSYIAKGGTSADLPRFISRVVNQIAVNIKRIRGLGATKIAVTSLEPLGCLPKMTQMSSFLQCNASQNLAVGYHNQLLQAAVTRLNNETKQSSIFVYDLYSSFTSVLQKKGEQQGNFKFETPLKPCCIGISSGYSCGSVDEKGKKMYTICNNPSSSFFWDSSHPTQAGWQAVHTTLKSSLDQFIKIY